MQVSAEAALGGPKPEALLARGPLRVNPDNPRYFTDGTTSPEGALKAILLTGSHERNNCQAFDAGDLASFDFDTYLELLQTNHQNFIRLMEHHFERTYLAFRSWFLFQVAQRHLAFLLAALTSMG